MTASDGDINVRLDDLWDQFGLSPDTPTAASLRQAAPAIRTWLEKGKEDPEIAVRAAQILLIDPELPGATKRAAWVPMRTVLTEVWPNAGRGKEHISYAQTLLLAAWPTGAQEGWLDLALLFDSARRATHWLEKGRKALHSWRASVGQQANNTQRLSSPAAPKPPSFEATQFAGIQLNTKAALKQVQDNQGHPHWQVVGPHVVQLLEQYRDGLTSLSDNLKHLSQQVAKYGQDLTAYAGNTVKNLVASQLQGLREEVDNSRGELNLLWWGQARYCHALSKSYRRLTLENDKSVVWWAAYEAAKLSLALDTEPAASYVVETLHSLGQDVFEKKPLIRWIEETHCVLQDAGAHAPLVGGRLTAIASGDALGLPVTWSRLKAAQKESLTDAADAVALELDTEIDRGEWASWAFREILLDLALADES